MENLEQPQAADSELPVDDTADSDVADSLEQTEADAEGGEPTAEEEEEFELGDLKLALPKSAAEKLKAGVMMQGDYTRKTQEVAEQRKAVEAQAAEVARARETQQQFVKDLAKVEALNDQLAAYDKVDWSALRQTDLDQYLEHQENRRRLEVERNTAAQQVTQKQEQFALEEQQSFAKQIQEAEAYVQREIQGWSSDRQAKVREYVQAEGVKLDPGFAKLLVQNPALMKVFDKAEKFDQLAKKQATKPTPPPAPAPATRVTAARQGAQRDPAKMSTAEWMAHRNTQVRKR
jgi:hypothetical protein